MIGRLPLDQCKNRKQNTNWDHTDQWQTAYSTTYIPITKLYLGKPWNTHSGCVYFVLPHNTQGWCDRPTMTSAAGAWLWLRLAGIIRHMFSFGNIYNRHIITSLCPLFIHILYSSNRIHYYTAIYILHCVFFFNLNYWVKCKEFIFLRHYSNCRHLHSP